MIFTSIEFVIFLVLTVCLYYALPAQFKNICLLLISYCFIAFSDIWTVPVIAIYSVIVYYCALSLENHKSKLLFISLLLLTLCPLIICKCTSFITILGVSYFTFKSIGYMVDVRSSKYPANKSIINVLLHISFFSELLSGPIDRGNLLLAQICDRDRKCQ